MKLDLNIPRPVWDAALMQCPAALQQDWAYGEALKSLGAGVIRAGILADNTLIGLVQLTTRRLGGVVQLALATRGPVWLEPADAVTRQAAYRALKSGLGLGWPRVTLVTPDEEAPPGVSRLSRVMTGYSTVMLDLDADLEVLRAGLDGKWRNRLNAAEKSDLKVQVNGTKLAQYRWLLETEEGQRTARGYRATPAALVPAFAEAKGDRSSLLILRADQGRSKVGAMLFLVHGRAATYQMGWADEAGRKSGAHNLLLWQAMEQLKARGIAQLDLGGVNTVSGAGIARFKIGTGGRVITLAGTFT